jgi:flagellar basal body rod protein FlgC
MNDFDILGAAASGMQAQRAAMDIDARNVALAQTGDVRHPAHGFVPQFTTTLASQDNDAPVAGIEAQFAAFDDDGAGTAFGGALPADGGVVALSGVRPSAQPIDSITEMINVLDAQRAYEADASTFDAGKRLFERTIDMGRMS